MGNHPTSPGILIILIKRILEIHTRTAIRMPPATSILTLHTTILPTPPTGRHPPRVPPEPRRREASRLPCLPVAFLSPVTRFFWSPALRIVPSCPLLRRFASPCRFGAPAGFRSPPPLLLMPAAAGPPPLPRECCRTLRPPRSGVGVSYLAPWSSARRRTALSSSPQLVHIARPPIVHTARPPSQCATDLDRTLAAAASLPLLQTYPAAMMPIPRFPPIHCATDFGCTLAAAASLPPHQTYPAAMMPFPRSPPIQ